MRYGVKALMSVAEELHQATILLVDDDQDNLFIMADALRRDGFTNVVCVSDPEKAADAFAETHPDMVVLDYRMPPVDGFYVLELLRKQPWPKIPVPVLMLSAGATESVKKRALEAGVVDFLHKSFGFTEMLLRIRNALNTHWLNRQLLQQNLLLEDMVALRTSELHQAHRGALAKLALAAEFRDDQTGAHTRRVGNLAAKIAYSMNLEPMFVADIRVAAPLHDVGKIGIPDEVLLKPGPLSEVEYDIVKAHPEIGMKILGESPEPIIKMARDIAYTHHERWDGQGYPRALPGESIPVCGRIVALADAFDAMTNDRQYRRAISHDRAVVEIQRSSGSHFDPAVVEGFLSIPSDQLNNLADEERLSDGHETDPSLFD